MKKTASILFIIFFTSIAFCQPSIKYEYYFKNEHGNVSKKFNRKHNDYSFLYAPSFYVPNSPINYLSDSFLLNRPLPNVTNVEFVSLFFNRNGVLYPNEKWFLQSRKDKKDFREKGITNNPDTAILIKVVAYIASKVKSNTKIVFQIHGFNVPGELDWYFGDEVAKTINSVDATSNYLIVRVVWDAGGMKKINKPNENPKRMGFEFSNKAYTTYKVGLTLRKIINKLESSLPSPHTYKMYTIAHSLGCNVAAELSINQVSKLSLRRREKADKAIIFERYKKINEPNFDALDIDFIDKLYKRNLACDSDLLPSNNTPIAGLTNIFIAAAMPGWNTFIDMNKNNNNTYCIAYNSIDLMLLKEKFLRNKLVPKFGSTTLGCDYLGEATVNTPLIFQKINKSKQLYLLDLTNNPDHYFIYYLHNPKLKASLKLLLK
ncbi:MAG: hypothetical protein IPP32_12605 [Bacteroidetes bacterium]|nr:hypothetical protein [Bacteroidota bacterium]